jgi:hypothetical protein
MRRVKLRASLATAGLVLTATATALAATAPNAVGPTTRIQPSGRQLATYGKLAALGNHPGGAALTTNGRFLWALDSGRGRNDIRIVDVAPELGCTQKGKHRKRRRAACRKRQRRRKLTGRIVQTIPMPGLSGGVAMAPNGRTAYVSGVADSPHTDEQSPPGTPGVKGDVIHVFSINRKTGIARRTGLIPVPPPPNTAPPQNFPPTNLSPLSWPRATARRSWPRSTLPTAQRS